MFLLDNHNRPLQLVHLQQEVDFLARLSLRLVVFLALLPRHQLLDPLEVGFSDLNRHNHQEVDFSVAEVLQIPLEDQACSLETSPQRTTTPLAASLAATITKTLKVEVVSLVVVTHSNLEVGFLAAAKII